MPHPLGPSGAVHDAPGAETATRIAAAVRPERLEALLGELAAHGARPDGGVDRPALSSADRAARRLLSARAAELGCAVHRDDAGNLFFTRPGARDAPPVAVGSHIDSQPTGGRLDGALGVCAGLEVIAAVVDAGVALPRPVEICVWMNEEGSRFAPGTMGSAAFAAPARLDGFRRAVDADGATVAAALDELDRAEAAVPVRPLGRPYHAFVEMHIEQGPVLEHAGVPVGVCDGVQAARWYEVSVGGVAAHAGTTPRSRRRDAMEAAAGVMAGLYALARDHGDELRLTIGRLVAEPGTINTVPERVTLTVDARHPDHDVLAHVERVLRDLTERCGGEVRRTMALPATRFDPTVRSALTDAARLVGVPARELVCGAFHDAVNLAEHCPTGMVLVPSIGGVSHHPSEATHPEDVSAGARVLAAATVLLAHDSTS